MKYPNFRQRFCLSSFFFYNYKGMKSFAVRKCACAISIFMFLFAACTPGFGKENAGNGIDEDTSNLTSEFGWQKEYKLRWEDFEGDIPYDINDNAAAATACSIGFEVRDTVDNGIVIAVFNIFYRKQSWVRSNGRMPDILAHEQGHFDICEIYTRMLRERIRTISDHPFSGDLKTRLRHIYYEVYKEYDSRQLAYETETNHGTDVAQQQKWANEIAWELNRTMMVAYVDKAPVLLHNW
jgi:Bacterial protein of unknown function (DUF922)